MKRINIDNIRYEYEDLSELSVVLQRANIVIGSYCIIESGCTIERDCTIGRVCRIGHGCTIERNCWIEDYCRIERGCTIDTSPLYIASELPFVFNGYADRIQIGCKDYTVDEWLKSYEAIAEKAGITDANIICKYHQLITLYSSWRGNQ